MPLANTRDKRTQILWGIRDFEHRFGRKPEGMWLSETAVDSETLDIMAGEGIRFTVLAPRQAKSVRGIGEENWRDVSGEKIDPKRPYLCRLPSGRAISLFFYDGPIAKDIAFGKLLSNGENFAKRLVSVFSQDDAPQIVHFATDGESYGHHHRFGDMALSYALHYIESNRLAELTNYGEFLEKHPPEYEAEIIENSSWSCAHGVERWKSNCGCSTGGHSGWSQAWREPLRKAMNRLRDTLIPLYEKEMALYVKDAWQIRDDYIELILDRSQENIDRFLAGNALRKLSEEEKVKVLKLLEMQRQMMFAYTSCGWFFDEISGIETVQVMQHAARVMQLAKETCNVSLEDDYIRILEKAPSNKSDLKNGAEVYKRAVKPAVVDLLGVAAHFAISTLFHDYPETMRLFCYTTKSEIYEREELGNLKLIVGRVHVHSDVTQEQGLISYAILHFGDHNLNGGVCFFQNESAFNIMRQEIKEAFLQSDISQVIRLMDNHFGSHHYSLWHLFRDEKRKILNTILDSTIREIESSYRHIYKHHSPLMQVIRAKNIPLPKALFTAVEFVLNTDIRRLLEEEELDLERLEELVDESKKWVFELDKTTLSFVASRKITVLMERLPEIPADDSLLATPDAMFRILDDISLLQTIDSLFRILKALDLELNLWKAQNIYFSIDKKMGSVMHKKAQKGDQTAQNWVKHFENIGNFLHVGNSR
jgi:hypothetical protein